jgi:hypothetical protein
MINEYAARLIILCLASFFLVQLGVGLVARLAIPRLASAAIRMDAKSGARLALALRWLPLLLALLVVAGVCIPSYLRFEPGDIGEEIGPVGLAAAVLGLAVWAAAFFRGSRQVVRSRRCIRGFASGRRPVLAVTGILSARVLISPKVVESLDQEQLEAALAHERAHVASHDNLKRLLLAFTPGLLPGISGLASAERLWTRLAEWAADDQAVAGDPGRAVVLATALVRVARLGSVPVPLASSMIEGDDLSARVARLLAPQVPTPLKGWREALAITSITTTVLIVLVAQSGMLESAHQLLERMME